MVYLKREKKTKNLKKLFSANSFSTCLIPHPKAISPLPAPRGRCHAGIGHTYISLFKSVALSVSTTAQEIIKEALNHLMQESFSWRKNVHHKKVQKFTVYTKYKYTYTDKKIKNRMLLFQITNMPKSSLKSLQSSLQDL